MSEINNTTIDRLKLNAYVDGELDQTEREAVDAYLAENPEAAAYVKSVKKQNRALQQEFDSVLDEDIPEFLMDTMAKNEVKVQHRFSSNNAMKSLTVYRMAASVLLFVLGGVLGWWLKPVESVQAIALADNGQFIQQARLAHVMYTPEKLHPVDVNADNEAHLVAWISKRLGLEIQAPQLSKQGFHLVGGRLLPNASGPSAQFMYENSVGERLTLYVNKNYDKDETAFEYFSEQGVSSFYWVDKSLVYALTGEIDRAKLLSVSHLVYNHFNQSML